MTGEIIEQLLSRWRVTVQEMRETAKTMHVEELELLTREHADGVELCIRDLEATLKKPEATP